MADGRARGHEGARLRREEYAHDARGKLTDVTGFDRDDLPSLWSRNVYSGLGALGWSATADGSGQGSFMAERVESDALANAVRIGRESSAMAQLPPMDLEMNHKGYLYEQGTGRLRRDWIGGDSALSTEIRSYDAAGNQAMLWRQDIQRTPWIDTLPDGTLTPDANLVDRTHYYYDAAERLRVLDRRSCLMVGVECTDRTPQLDDRSVFEEHRYDALGRRVMLRARQPQAAFCASVLCRSNLVRTVWDGDQILHEISVQGVASMDRSTWLASFLGPHHYGRVMYVHGGGIDQPIAVVRSEYSDSLHTGTVYPLANHKGQYDMGISTCVLVTPRSPMLTEHHGEQQIGTDTVTHQIGDTTPYEHCIRVEWPGRRSFSSGYRRHSWGPAPPWVGSLLYHGKDPSGQMYRRNRFYDPASGRFTQEDPIGIAGGLNVYGYANGDPISYRDPFGLKADSIYVIGSAEFRRKVSEGLRRQASRQDWLREGFNAIAASPKYHITIREQVCRIGYGNCQGMANRRQAFVDLWSNPNEAELVNSAVHEVVHALGDFQGLGISTGINPLCGNPDARTEGCIEYYDNLNRSNMGLPLIDVQDGQEFASRTGLPPIPVP